MKKRLTTALVVVAAMIGAAFGEDSSTTGNFPFNGGYVGANLGGVWNRTCANWTPYVAGFRVQDWVYSKCPNNNAFTGGVTLGYNIVASYAMLGLEADYNGWSSTSKTHVLDYTGTTIPAGTYNSYGKTGPNGGGTLRLRLGFVAHQFMPYVTGGLAYASSSPSATIAYTPVGAASPSAVFAASRTLNTSGWTAGGGFEYGLTPHLSMKVEYLYMQFGHTARHVNSCSGAACPAFVAINTNFSTSNSGEIDMFRVGINYLFSGP